MKNVVKSVVFVAILLLLIEVLSYVFVPGSNIFTYGTVKVSNFDILTEKKNTIDVIGLGDSLVYSSFSPMQLWHDFGYTAYDCAGPAQTTRATYEYLEAALDAQSPKVVLMESAVLYRNPYSQNWKNKVAAELKKYVPIAKYHDNWKKYLKDGLKDSWLDVYKGYKYITKVKGYEGKSGYMDYTTNEEQIPQINLDYFDKIVKLCEKKNIKLVMVSFPSIKSWNYAKHNTVSKVFDKYNLEFIDLNLIDLDINWRKDTKDKGNHLNYKGAKKVTQYLGNYLKETGLLEDHRNDSSYKSWDKAYNIYIKSF